LGLTAKSVIVLRIANKYGTLPRSSLAGTSINNGQFVLSIPAHARKTVPGQKAEGRQGTLPAFRLQCGEFLTPESGNFEV